MNRPANRPTLQSAGMYLLLILIGLLFLLPMLTAVNTAFKHPREVYRITSLPASLYLLNFREAFLKVGRSLLNSFLIAAPSTILATLVGTLAAYPLSQLRFRGDALVYLLLLAGMYIPFQTVLIPAFLVIKTLGLYDTLPGLWLAHTAYGIPFTTLILRNFFATIPFELREAATIDGCSLAAYYWRILLPVGRTGVATVLILQFNGSWNDFLFGLTFTRSAKLFPVTVAIQSFITPYEQQWGPLMASTCLAILPTIVVYLIFRRHFIRGLIGVYK